MQRRVLGSSGIAISEIGFGLWAAGGDFWGPTDDAAILDAIDYSLAQGVNFFDTADVYGGGHSEELLGRAMRGRRAEFVVATKIGWRGFSDETKSSAYTTVGKLVAGVESNLRRLQTDYIDVIQSHVDFRDPTMEVVVEGFQHLQRDGKVRAYGVSTSNFEYLQAFNADGGCSSLQVDYSILNRTPERDVLPYCQEHGIGVIVRGALAMGILAGKFDADTRFPDGDFRRRWHDDEDEYRVFRDDLARVEQLRPLAQGCSLAQLALRFVLAHPAVTTVIPGIKDVGQAQANIAAGMLEVSLEGIDAVVPPGGGRKIWPA
ncbi:MAG: aldo/keto reductase [Xanthomonadales bacterium]|nr:aldo/keto reductase [Xanthomonadales bacterium]NIN60272.1 aldo/keto reductase [Xanthomonadales bacterium]NIN75624.1 aldo/keto reductase [Xanthomonadales bacterium]NIO14697.1 aldo/keto reductase [Xanthomonadales bacterium]NIP12665.1 aldo/keto reductase [Xanthomonadales bacterium]